MSYILDAVARSEQERQQQSAPGPQVLALGPAVPEPRRRWILWVVAGALLLNAVVLAIWLQSRPLALNPVAMPARVPGSAPGSAPGPMSGPTPGPVSGPVSRKPPASQPLPRGGETNRDTRLAGATAAGPVDSEAASASGEPGAGFSTRTSPATAASTATTDDGTAIGGDGETAGWIRIGPQTLGDRAAGAAPSAGDATANETRARVSHVGDLPDELRRDLPTVVFSGHLYSSNPASSMVFVDGGRPVSPGRRITDEVYLHEITPAGVVVEFRGYLIDVGVLQNWTLN